MSGCTNKWLNDLECVQEGMSDCRHGEAQDIARGRPLPWPAPPRNIFAREAERPPDLVLTNSTAEAVEEGLSVRGQRGLARPMDGSSLKPCWGVSVRAVRVTCQGRLEAMVSWMATRFIGSSRATVCIL